MAEFLDDSVYDSLHVKVETGTRLTICSGQPANFAGIAAVSLGEVVMTPADYTIGDATPNGRKVTVANKLLTPSATGTVLVHAIDDGVTLLATTDVNPDDIPAGFPVVSGAPVNTGEFEVTTPDAVGV